jgi:hypothetical protein
MDHLADAILLLHLAFVLFVAAGFLVIPVGGALGWRWVRARRLRLAHLGAIAVVAAESLAGIACPLTVWEDVLRGGGGGGSFVSRLLHRFLFYDLPEAWFTAVYVFLALGAGALWVWVRPFPSGRRD